MSKTIIEMNQEAWDKVSEAHYHYFKEALKDPQFKLNPLVDQEIGDLSGKRVLHLQCNTGADSIFFARKGAEVVGVDFSFQNVKYAKMLADDFQIPKLTFIQSDVLTLDQHNLGTFDLIISTDGVLGWIPDLIKWGKIVHHFLAPDGEVFLHDSHPTMMIFDEDALPKGQLIPKYPYFDSQVEKSNEIGGYASESKEAENYFYGHQMQTILNAFIQNDMYLTMFKEHDRCVSGMGGSKKDDSGLMYYPELDQKIPLVYSLKAKKR